MALWRCDTPEQGDSGDVGKDKFSGLGTTLIESKMRGERADMGGVLLMGNWEMGY